MNSCGGATNVRPYGRTDIRSCQRCAIPVRPPEPRSPRLEPHLYRICGGLLPLKSELGSPNPVQVRSIPGPGLAGDTRPNPIGGAAAARSRFPWAPRPSLVYPRTCTYCDGGRHSRASACRPSPYEEFTVNATRRILSSARGDLVIRGKNMLRGGWQATAARACGAVNAMGTCGLRGGIHPHAPVHTCRDHFGDPVRLWRSAAAWLGWRGSLVGGDPYPARNERMISSAAAAGARPEK